MLKFIHAADFHLDSAFGALTARQAAAPAAGEPGAGLPAGELREQPRR